MMLPKKFLIKLNPFAKWASCNAQSLAPSLLFSSLLGYTGSTNEGYRFGPQGPPFSQIFFFKGYHHIIHIDIIKFIHYLHNTKTSQRKTRVKSKRDGTNQNRSIVPKIRADFHLGNNQAYKPVHKKGSHQLRLEQQPNVDNA